MYLSKCNQFYSEEKYFIEAKVYILYLCVGDMYFKKQWFFSCLGQAFLVLLALAVKAKRTVLERCSLVLGNFEWLKKEETFSIVAASCSY